MVTRLSRPQRTEQNRRAVLAAAREVFLEKGYAGASLDAIAQAAGFSKGVMYSQFGSKADLFLALLEERISERAEVNRRAVSQARRGDAGRALLRTALRLRDEEAGWARLLIEFRALAARDPELNARYAEAHEKTVSALTEIVEGVLESTPGSRPAASRTIAEFVLALDSGFTLERAANPAALPIDAVADLVARALGADG